MSAKFPRNAFTLIEVLIVVVIMAVLAATIIPQFSSSAEDAKTSALKYNLHTLRSQIEMYKLQHKGDAPDDLTGSTLPQLLGTTNADGDVGTGANFPFGPYIQGNKLPANPLDGVSTVTATAAFPPTAETAAGGWLYHAATGQIAPNTEEHLTD